jgi:hypothetical protein
MVLEPLGHQRFNERFFFGLLLGSGVRNMMRSEGV